MCPPRIPRITVGQQTRYKTMHTVVIILPIIFNRKIQKNLNFVNRLTNDVSAVCATSYNTQKLRPQKLN